MNEILICAGSNMDKETNLPAAFARLAAAPGLTPLAISSLLATPAVGPDGLPADQPGYHNAALRARTALGLAAVRELLRAVEAELGRVRSADKFAARPIDLDLAWYGDPQAAVTTGAGEHPLDAGDLRHAHVVIPLAEVAPDWVHPQTGVTLASIAAALGREAQESR